MSEESRLGRVAIETAWVLKRITDAGVRVFFYLDDRERTLNSPTDKVMLSLTAFAAEMERDRARVRTHDTLMRKAKAGAVTGGVVFGYVNRPVLAHGRRSHVERVIEPREAAVVRRIFTLAADGWGVKRIAAALNVESAPAPLPAGVADLAGRHRQAYARCCTETDLLPNVLDRWGRKFTARRWAVEGSGSRARWARAPRSRFAIPSRRGE